MSDWRWCVSQRHTRPGERVAKAALLATTDKRPALDYCEADVAEAIRATTTESA